MKLHALSYDAGAQTLTHKVYGLRLDDPATLTPLPDTQQARPPAPPEARSRSSLFLNFSDTKEGLKKMHENLTLQAAIMADNIGPGFPR